MTNDGSFFSGGGRFAFGNPLKIPNQSFSGLLSKTTPTCFLSSSTTISVGTGIGVFTLLTWDTTIYQTDSAMHSNTVNSSRITIQVPGKYLLFAQIGWPYDVSGTTRRIRLLSNGVAQTAQLAQFPNGTVPKLSPTLVGMYAVSRGNYLELDADHDATGTLLFTPISFGVLFVTP